MTEPFPLPVAPAVMVSHASLLTAVQAQPVDVVTATVPVPAAAVGLADAGEMVGVHGAPAWVIVKVLPPIVSVAVRAVVLGFAETL